MKKRVFVPIMVIIFLGVFVSAMMVNTSSLDNNKVNYNLELPIEKGWNLVLASPLYGTKDNTILSDSEVKKENIKAIFYYFKHENRYLQMYPDSEEVDNYLRNAQEKPEEIFYFAQSPVWVYSDKAGILKYSRTDVPNPSFPSLSAGWNFVTVTPDMQEKTIFDMKGDCVMQKVYLWQASLQQWSFNLLEDVSAPDQFSSSDAGAGLIIKVSSNCRFGEAISSITPPQIPN